MIGVFSIVFLQLISSVFDGKIAEEGQYDELLAHQAYFYELLNRAKGGEKITRVSD